MQFPQLQIETTPARLGLQTTQPTQRIEQPKPTIEQAQPAAILEIRTTRPQLTIDTKEAWASMGKKNPLRMMDEFAEEGLQAIQEGIGRRAAEGMQLMQIEKGGDAARNIAVNLAHPPPADLNVRFLLGRYGVKVNFEPGTVDIEIQPQQPQYNVQVNPPIHDYTPGKVEGIMEQYPSIRIDVKA